MALEEPRQRRGRGRDAVPGKMPAQLCQRHVGSFFERGMDQPGMRLDPARPRVTALGLRRESASEASFGVPADRRRGRDPKPTSRLATTETLINSRDHTRP